MRAGVACGTVLSLLACGAFVGCSNTHNKFPDVSDQIRNGLDQAGLKDVSVHQDRDKGVVTLTGTTISDSDRGHAESIAKSIASSEVVSDQIAVRPAGEESVAKTVDSDTDKGIEKNFDAVLVKHKLEHTVKYDVKDGVVTLSGKVKSETQRDDVQKMASNVPNVRQVVNELEVRGHKATTSKASSSD
jgi:hyperosmotically inducible periplasmic protein